MFARIPTLKHTRVHRQILTATALVGIASLASAQSFLEWTGGDGTWDSSTINWDDPDATLGSATAWIPGRSGEIGNDYEISVSGTQTADNVRIGQGTSLTGGTLALSSLTAVTDGSVNGTIWIYSDITAAEQSISLFGPQGADLVFSGQATAPTGFFVQRQGQLFLPAGSSISAASGFAVGNDNDSTSIFAAANGATVQTGGDIDVGFGAFSISTFNVSGGGTVNADGDIDIATGGASTATVNVSGAGSVMSAIGHFWVGTADAGSATTTSMNITSGGLVSSGGSFSLADTAATTDSTVTESTLAISGTGSTLDVGTVFWLGYAGTGEVTVSNGGTIIANGDIVLGQLSGASGTLKIFSGGTVIVGGTDGIRAGAGSATVRITTNGTLRLSDDLTSSVSIRVGGNPIFDTNGYDAVLSGVIQDDGDGKVYKVGDGILALTGNNTYGDGLETFATLVSGGLLEFGTLENLSLDADNPTQDTIRLDGGGLRWASGSTLDISPYIQYITDTATFDTNGNDVTLSSGLPVLGSATGVGLIKTGSGELTLNTTFNDFDGPVTIKGGTLSIALPGTVGSGSISVIDGAALSGFSNLSFDRSVSVDGSGSALTVPGYLEFGSAGTGSLTVSNGAQVSSGTSTVFGVNAGSDGSGLVTGAGSLLDVGSALTLGISGTGSLTVSDGATLRAGSVYLATTGGTGTLSIESGSTLEIDGGAITAPSISTGVSLTDATLRILAGEEMTHSANISLTGNNLIDTKEFNLALSGDVTGSGTLEKTGSGLLQLNSVNTYSGLTTISEGTVRLFAASGLGTGGVTISGGRLESVNGLALDETTTVSGSDSSLHTDDWLDIGTGTASTLTVEDGATVTTGTSTWISAQPGINATASVTGIDSRLDTGTLLSVGHRGTGELTIGNGGTVTTGSLSLGSSGGSSGTLNLNDGGTLEVSGEGGISGGSGDADFNLAGGTLRVTDANLSTAIPIGLAGSSTIDTQGFDGTFAGAFSGTGGLAKEGSGKLILNAASAFDGGIDVNAGTLEVTGGVTVQPGGDINVATTSTSSASISVSGTDSILDTPGHLWLGTGTSSTSSLGVSDGGSVATGTTLSIADATGTDSTVALSGSGSSLTTVGNLYVGYAGSGVATIGDGASVSVGATLEFGSLSGADGTLNLQSGGMLSVGGSDGIAIGSGSGTFNLAGGTIAVTGSALSTSIPISLSGDSTIDTNGLAATLTGALSGAGSLEKAGVGDLELASANSHSGGTTVSGGSLSVANVTPLGSGPVAVSNGAALASSANLEFAQDVTVDGAGSLLSTTDYLEFGSSGDGSLALTGGGAVQSGSRINIGFFAEDTGSASVSDAGSRLSAGERIRVGVHGTGSLTVESGGTVAPTQLVVGEMTGSEGTFNLNSGGILEVGGSDGILAGSGTTHLNLSGGTVQVTGTALTSSVDGTLTGSTGIDTNSLGASLSGSFSGSGGLTKTGEGMLTISGASTFTGDTLVEEGMLKLEGSLAAANTIVETAGSLTGNGTSTGDLAINGGGRLDPGASVGSLGFASATFAEGGSLTWEISDALGTPGSDPGWDLLTLSGDLSIASTSGTPFQIDLQTLNVGGSPGPMANFASDENYAWTIVATGSGILDFDPNRFALDSSGIVNDWTGGTFGLRVAGNDLQLTFTAIPEPLTTGSLLALVALALVTIRRRGKLQRP